MQNSSDIRRLNFNRIRRILWQGGSYTKQEIAGITRLSVATCNTLLNELETQGEVTGQKSRVSGVGRSTVCYTINETHDSLLCIAIDLVRTQRKIQWWILSLTGKVLDCGEKECETLDGIQLLEEIGDLLLAHDAVSEIVIGIPGIAENGVIQHCDLKELDGLALQEELAKRTDIPVFMENDMHLKVYGYYSLQKNKDDIVTLACFYEHIMPGSASICQGTMIKGHNQFAGMVGYLPYGMSREQYLENMHYPECLSLIEQAILSIIVLINPSAIVFTGDLLSPEILQSLEASCKEKMIPGYMPRFIYQQSLRDYYLEGMYRKALDQKEAHSFDQ